MQQGQSTERPKISVVIASVNGPSYVGACLDSLEKQTLRDQAEVIVADCHGDGVTELIRRSYPDVRLLSFRERKSIPELRAIGMKNSRGEIIAVTEDHCLADSRWYERILAAHQAQRGAVGGAVENASVERLVDWAVYFCEYNAYMNPVPAGEVGDIPGNNASYKREFLGHWGDMLDGGFWESFLHQRLQEKGVRLFSDPAIVVYHKKSFGFGEFMSQRYHYARSYAGMRVKGASLPIRLCYAGFCSLLPALLVARIGARVWSKKRFRGKFLQALPLLLIFSLSWAFGEFWGYLLGPGESLKKVE